MPFNIVSFNLSIKIVNALKFLIPRHHADGPINWLSNDLKKGRRKKPKEEKWKTTAHENDIIIVQL